MQNVSSQATLFLKLVFPVFWFAFFGTLTAYVFFNQEGNIGGALPPMATKALFLTVMLGGLAWMYFFFIRLKRVEMDEEFLYVTNYRKVFKYPYSNIESISEKKGLIRNTVSVTFVEAGYFGKKISFLAGSSYLEFLGKHPEIAKVFSTE